MDKINQILNRLDFLEKKVKELDKIINPAEDELLKKARNMVKGYKEISTSFLQRTLAIGYTRAARIMDILSSEKILEESAGIKPRKVINKK